MAKKPVPKLEDLKPQYAQLIATAKIRSSFKKAAGYVAKQIIADKDKYTPVSTLTDVPWWWVAITHHMEAGGNFACHLHNGDSLAYRTYHVPKNRPLKGNPVFTWVDSACDALTMHGLDEVKTWDLASAAYYWEGYNGWGYRWYHPSTLSAYLFSGTQHYSSGKYTSDGVWSDSAVSGQLGAIAILKAMLEIEPGLFEVIDDAGLPAPPPLAEKTSPLPGPSALAPASYPKAHEVQPSWWQEKWKHLAATFGIGAAGTEAASPHLPTSDQAFSFLDTAQSHAPALKNLFSSGLLTYALIAGGIYLLVGHILPRLLGGSDAST